MKLKTQILLLVIAGILSIIGGIIIGPNLNPKNSINGLNDSKLYVKNIPNVDITEKLEEAIVTNTPIDTLTPTITMQPISTILPVAKKNENTNVNKPSPQPKCSAEDIKTVEDALVIANNNLQTLLNQKEQIYSSCKSDESNRRQNGIDYCKSLVNGARGLSPEALMNCINGYEDLYYKGLAYCESSHEDPAVYWNRNIANQKVLVKKGQDYLDSCK